MKTNTICKQLNDHSIDFDLSADNVIHALSVSTGNGITMSEWVNVTKFTVNELFAWLGY